MLNLILFIPYLAILIYFLYRDNRQQSVIQELIRYIMASKNNMAYNETHIPKKTPKDVKLEKEQEKEQELNRKFDDIMMRGEITKDELKLFKEKDAIVQ